MTKIEGEFAILVKIDFNHKNCGKPDKMIILRSFIKIK